MGRHGFKSQHYQKAHGKRHAWRETAMKLNFFSELQYQFRSTCTLAPALAMHTTSLLKLGCLHFVLADRRHMMPALVVRYRYVTALLGILLPCLCALGLLLQFSEINSCSQFYWLQSINCFKCSMFCYCPHDSIKVSLGFPSVLFLAICIDV